MRRQRLTIRRGVVALALGALAASGSAAVPAPAGAAIANADVDVNTNFYTPEPADCLDVSPGVDAPPGVPWTDNGVPVTRSHTRTGFYRAAADATDVVDLVSSASASVRSTPITGGPATIRGSGSATSSTDPRLGSTTCEVKVDTYATLTGQFTLPRPMWATLTTSATGNGGAYLDLDVPGGLFRYSFARTSSGNVSVLLPAGTITLYLEVLASARSTTAVLAEAYSVSFTVDLLPLGHPSALAGKGKRYVKFGARDCASGDIGASLTKKARKRASKVVVTVNGKKAAAFKGKRLKKRSFPVAVASASKANLSATVTLRSGKRLKVARSYLECS